MSLLNLLLEWYCQPQQDGPPWWFTEGCWYSETTMWPPAIKASLLYKESSATILKIWVLETHRNTLVQVLNRFGNSRVNYVQCQFTTHPSITRTRASTELWKAKSTPYPFDSGILLKSLKHREFMMDAPTDMDSACTTSSIHATMAIFDQRQHWYEWACRFRILDASGRNAAGLRINEWARPPLSSACSCFWMNAAHAITFQALLALVMQCRWSFFQLPFRPHRVL